MNIDPKKCVMCGQCIPYCPVESISMEAESAVIDQDGCVECGICLRNAKCPTEAINQPYIAMPRAVRKSFSDPFGKHVNVEHVDMGRGTEEIKTNDVVGRLTTLDSVVMAIEMGRPMLGARFTELQKVTKALSRFNLEYEKNNPVTPYIIDKTTGAVEPSILNEKVLSCILEFRARVDDLEEILAALKKVGSELDTVFSVDVIAKFDDNNHTRVEDILKKNGYPIYGTSSKTNMGLGRPRYEDRIKGGK